MRKSEVSNETIFPTRWIYGFSRETAAHHLIMLRRIDRKYAVDCRNYGIYLGNWPISFRRADGTRFIGDGGGAR